MRVSIDRIRTFAVTHERPLSAGALFVGFIVDSLTLKRIDLLFENIVVLSYLAVAAIAIAVLNLRERRLIAHRFGVWLVAALPFVLQIVFGALFSAFIVFYSRSAALSASWPFMLFLAAMLIGNEKFRRHYERTTFHVAVWFVALLSYCIFAVPTIVGSIGPIVFLASVGVALAVFAGFVRLLGFVVSERVRATRDRIMKTAIGISFVVVLMYAVNLIPPIPLALKDSAVAHEVVRVGNDYHLTVEPRSFLDRIRLKEVYHRNAGERVSVWTSVFAPTDLTATIVHEWQYRQDNEWMTTSRIVFPIVGGADGGYRGYSTKAAVVPGAWRVSVETERGQVIGRVRFDIVDTNQPSELEVIVR